MRNFLSCRLWLTDLRNLIAMIVSTARLNPDFLGAAFSFITSSLNQTRSELTAIGGSTQRVVRDVKKCTNDTVGLYLYADDIYTCHS